jgi:hypothetical protein
MRSGKSWSATRTVRRSKAGDVGENAKPGIDERVTVPPIRVMLAAGADRASGYLAVFKGLAPRC